MAGLWQWAEVQNGYEQTFAIVTTAANAVVAPIHDRMPAILEGDSLTLWLSPKAAERDPPGLLGPARDYLLERRAVSMAINDAKNDVPALLA